MFKGLLALGRELTLPLRGSRNYNVISVGGQEITYQPLPKCDAFAPPLKGRAIAPILALSLLFSSCSSKKPTTPSDQLADSKLTENNAIITSINKQEFSSLLKVAESTEDYNSKEPIIVTSYHGNWDIIQNNTIHFAGEKFEEMKLQSELDFSSKFDPRFNFQEPIIASNGNIILITSNGIVKKYNSGSELLWKHNLNETRKQKQLYKMARAVLDTEEAILYVVMSYGDIEAIDFSSGRTLWRNSYDHKEFRSSPVIFLDKIFITSLDNKVFAIARSNGTTVWSHEALSEELVSSRSPNIVPFTVPQGDKEMNAVLAAYSSGKLELLDATSGSIIWGSEISSASHKTLVNPFTIFDIDITPVIDKTTGGILASTINKKLVYILPGKAESNWEIEESLAVDPIISGQFAFVITEGSQLVSIHLPTGKVQWIIELPKYFEQTVPKYLNNGSVNYMERKYWHNPMLTDKGVVILNDFGEMILVDPENGKIKERFTSEKMSDFASNFIMIDNKFYMINKSGELLVYR